MEQGKMFFCIRNSLVLSKGLMYISTTPKGETEGVLAFVVPVGQCHLVLNGVHHNASHWGQQRTLALAQERFWWPMMAEDCRAIVRGCPCCRAFEGEVPRAPLCPIQVYALLELVHLDYTSIESTMELNKPPMVKNILVMMDHFTRYARAVVTKDQTAKTVAKVFYKHFIAVFGAPVKWLSDRGANFTSALVEELCAAFGIQKCRTTAYHAQCNRAGASISEESIARSTLVEHTSLGVESGLPEGSVDGTDTLSPASRIPLGWVGGVLWPLPSVALRPTMWRGLGAGDGV